MNKDSSQIEFYFPSGEFKDKKEIADLDDFNNYTLLDEVLLEGLAENFGEKYFDPEVSKWAGALTKDQAFDVLKESKDILESRDQKVIKEFLFGNDKYQRWTGYSVGYWLVKNYIERNPELSWDEIIKRDSRVFLKGAK